MKYGIAFANTMQWAKGPGAIELARAADDAGFESLWTVEHVVYPDDYSSPYPYSADGKMPAQPSTPIPDPLIWLAYVASVTTSIRLATGILILPQRNPVVLAKELATLDRRSRAGGSSSASASAGSARSSTRSASRGSAAARAPTSTSRPCARCGPPTARASTGEFASFTRVSSNPKPAQGQMPIVIGGHSRVACRARRPARRRLLPRQGHPAELREMIDIVRQTAAAHDRDPAAIEITAGALRSSATTRSAPPRSSPRSG